MKSGVSKSKQLWKPASKARVSRRRAIGLASLGAALVGILPGCGGGHRTTGSTSPAKGAAAKPKYGGQLNVTLKSDPFDLDPSHKASANHVPITKIYESLLAFKAGPDVHYDQLVLTPALAERWEAPDAQTYTFHLRPGAKFANLPPLNGRAVTSADVKWSLEYLSRTGAFLAGKKVQPSQFVALYTGLERVDTPDNATAVVHFGSPFAPYQNYAGSDFNPVLAHEIFDDAGDFSKQSVGAGPFQLDVPATQHGSRWVFKKNSTYFREGRPYIDQINYLVLQDDAAVFAGFQSKQLDRIAGSGLGAAEVQRIKQNSADAVVSANTAALPWHIYMNTKKPPLDDERVRQALGLAIDRDNLLKTFFAGQGGWALAGAFPDTFTQAEVRQIVKYDPGQAKQLLSAAGHADGVEIEFIYPGADYGQLYISVLQLFQQQLKQAGINLTLKSLDKQTESLRKKKRDFQLTFTPKALGGQDIDAYLYGVFYPGSTENYGQIDDPQLTPMLEAQRREVDAAKRKAICRQAVRHIYDHALAFGLFRPVSYEVWHPYLKNYAPNFGSHGMPVTNSWLEK